MRIDATSGAPEIRPDPVPGAEQSGEAPRSVTSPSDPPPLRRPSYPSTLAAFRAFQSASSATETHSAALVTPEPAMQGRRPLDSVGGADSFAGCLQSPEGQRIREYLSAQPEVTVLVGVAPNHGHQKAALTGMRRLQEAGFTGKFAVLVEGDNKFARKKFEFLAKSYPAIKWALCSETNPPSKNELGITFGCDDVFKIGTAEGLAAQCRSNSFIHIGPTGWTKGRHEIYTRGRQQDLPDLVVSEGILECGSPTSFAPAKDVSHEVASLVRGRSNNKFQVVSIYRLCDWPGGICAKDELDLVLRGLLERKIEQPVVVAVVGDLPKLAPDIARHKNVKVVADASLLRIFPPGKNSITLIHLRKISDTSFHHLRENSDLLIAEGANSISGAKKSGIPFLVAGQPVVLNAVSDSEFAAHPDFQKASLALTTPLEPSRDAEQTQAGVISVKQQRVADLSDYLDKCLDKQLTPFYEDWSARFRDRPDKCFEALRMLTADDIL